MNLKITTLGLTLAAISATLPTAATANADLAKSKNCTACHAVDKKIIGPSYQDVSAKYAKDKDAVAKLTEKVMKGSTGAWGAIPMPANPQVSQAEAESLVKWVLDQKK